MASPPLVPYGTTFPPQKRGNNKAPRNITIISCTTLSTGCTATACGVAEELESHHRPENPVTRFPLGIGGATFPSRRRRAPRFSQSPATHDAPVPPTGSYHHLPHLLHVPRSFAALSILTGGRRGSPIPVPIPAAVSKTISYIPNTPCDFV